MKITIHLLIPIAAGAVLLLATGLQPAGAADASTSSEQESARQMLHSPATRYLSGTGQNALRTIAGAGMATAERRADLQAGDEDGPPDAALVNNPKRDLNASNDVTTQSETAVAAFGANIVVAYNDDAKSSTRGGMGYAHSTDGGATFSDLGPIPTSATSLNLGDPSLVVNRAGVFFVSYLAADSSRPPGFSSTLGVSKSTDGGVTWGTPVFPPPSGVQPLSFQDKSFLAIDNSRGPNQGNLYLTWTSFAPPPAVLGNLPILLSRSTDGGATFSSPIQVSSTGTVNSGSAPAIGPNGEVYVAWLQFSPVFAPTPTVIKVAKSLDGGKTFQAPATAGPVTIPGFALGTLVGAFRVNAFPRIAVNPVNGEIYVVYTSKPAAAEDACDVLFVRSADGGATWSSPKRVNDDETFNDQYFPDVAVNARGEMRIFWYDRRMDPDNFRIGVFTTRSTDGGRTFERNHPLIPGDSLPSVGYDLGVSGIYMGDYIDVKANTTPTGLGNDFLFAWGDFRRFVTTGGGRRPDQDVYFLLQKGSHDQ